MLKNLSALLLICLMLIGSTACSNEAEMPEFRASCADVAGIRLFSPYPAIEDVNYDPTPIYYVFVAFTPETRREYFKFSWNTQGAPFRIYINDAIYVQATDQRAIFKQYGEETKALYGEVFDQIFDDSIATRDILGFDRASYFTGPSSFKSYAEALAFADTFCPNKVKRGRENVLYSPPESIDWPPPAE